MIFARRCIGAIEHGISMYILVFGSERVGNKISPALTVLNMVLTISSI